MTGASAGLLRPASAGRSIAPTKRTQGEPIPGVFYRALPRRRHLPRTRQSQTPL